MASRPPRLPGVPQEVFGSLGRPGENGLLLSCRSLDPAIAKCDLPPTPEVDSGKGVRKTSGDAPGAVRDSEFAKPLWKCRGGLGATLRPLPLQQPLAPNPALDCAQFRYLRRAEQALRPQIMPYAAAFGGGATVATWLPGANVVGRATKLPLRKWRWELAPIGWPNSRQRSRTLSISKGVLN